jgi:hypothetical protein
VNINKRGLFWGILLIAAGGLLLAKKMGYINQHSERLWIWVFALISLLAFLNYALSGWKRWGWLFPAGVFGGLAVTTWLASAGINKAAVASPLFIGLLVPFSAAYLTDRSRNWWALIPGGVMLFLTLTTLLVDWAGGAWIGSLFLFMAALSFLVVYLNNRTRTWALLVAYILGVLGIAPGMASVGNNGAYYGAVFLFAIGVPFFVIYSLSAAKWWAIIPAGALTTLAIVTALAIAGLIRNESQGGYANAILMVGLAITFGVLWLRHGKTWAKAVTIVLAVVAVGSIFFVSYSQIFWPAAIILGGVYLLYTAMRPKTV